MMHRLYTTLQENERFAGVLHWYLVWGFAVRSLLLLGLTILLVVEGNFLLEWLLSWGLSGSSQADLQEITMFSYIVIGAILVLGMVLRAGVLYRIGYFDRSTEVAVMEALGRSKDVEDGRRNNPAEERG